MRVNFGTVVVEVCCQHLLDLFFKNRLYDKARETMEIIAYNESRSSSNSSINAVQNNNISTTNPSRGTNSSRRSIIPSLLCCPPPAPSQWLHYCRGQAGRSGYWIVSPHRRRWNTVLIVVVSYAVGMYLYFSWVVFSSTSWSRAVVATQRDTLLNQGVEENTVNIPYYKPTPTPQKMDNSGDTLSVFLTTGHHQNSTRELAPNFFQDTLYNNSTNTKSKEQILHNITTRETIQAPPQDRSTLHRKGSSYGVLTFLSWILFSLLVRLFSSHLHHRRDTTYFPLRQRHPTNYLQHPQQQGQLRQQQQQRHFHSMVTRINQQRQLYGERPLSVESLRFILLSSPQNDFNGQDYDQLLQLVEENGDVPTLLSDMMGATEAEINRCPSRTLRNTKDISVYKSCSVCLEPYQIHDTIRTIPCFHSFHVGCIDPWLRQKATCPICKHSAIG